MSQTTNKRLILKKRPYGFPEKDCWELEEIALPSLQDGELLIENYYVSLDPAMRGWIREGRSYIPPVQLEEVMRAGTAGKVLESRNATFKPGDYVVGWGGVQLYTVTDGKNYHKVDPKLAPLPLFISTLGMPGMTAYFGILEVGQIKEGEVILVSGAAGAVGSVVGQIARIKGCKVIGIAGGKEKCDYLLHELGFDAAIDYKSENVKTKILEYAPQGIDVYFDNVGGEILDIALTCIRFHARIVICGAISQYNNASTVQGPSNYLSLLVNRARMEGMVVMDYAKDYKKAATEMSMWIAQGKLKSKEDIYEGIDNFYDTFCRLFTGDKLGKLILKVAEER